MARKIKCWKCGAEIDQSAVPPGKDPYHAEVRLVLVNRPYAYNHKTKPVWFCGSCTKECLGISREGKNLNPHGL